MKKYLKKILNLTRIYNNLHLYSIFVINMVAIGFWLSSKTVKTLVRSIGIDRSDFPRYKSMKESIRFTFYAGKIFNCPGVQRMVHVYVY